MKVPVTELADIPLGELQTLREKIGTKRFDVVLQRSREERQKHSFKRANKNRYYSQTVLAKSGQVCAWVRGPWGPGESPTV